MSTQNKIINKIRHTEMDVRGKPFTNYFNAIHVEYTLDYEPDTHDRILLTYHRSGTWWTTCIIDTLINDGKLADNQLNGVKNCLEYYGKAVIDGQPIGDRNVRLIRSHMSLELFPYSPEARYLIVLRNPKDVCVSYYNLFQKYYHFEYNFSDYFEYWLNSMPYPHGDYFVATRHNWEHRDRPNCTVMTYEYMLDNPGDSVAKIAGYLGTQYVTRLSDADPITGRTLLERVIQASGLETMKGYKVDAKYVYCYGKGMAGNWRSVLSKGQSDLIDQKVRDEWMGTGLETLWERHMKWQD